MSRMIVRMTKPYLVSYVMLGLQRRLAGACDRFKKSVAPESARPIT